VDVALVRQMADGNEIALERLYDRHAPTLLGYLIELTGDRLEAEEVLQDTMVAAWKSARAFAGRSQVRTWLFGIARRRLRDGRRRRILERAQDTELGDLDGDESSPEHTALVRAELADLTTLIASLGALQREVLALAFVHELSYAEMADVLEVSVGTVKSRLSNARRALQTLLAEREEATQ